MNDAEPLRVDDTFTDEEREKGRKLFAQTCTFLLGAAQQEQIPESDFPEIAFAGRSNVGKSSLINALTCRKALARTSHTPGRTQQVNFFDLGGRLVLADLPGYGYARAPKGEVQKWTRLVNAYLKGRVQLKRVQLLIDARHGLKDVDHTLMTMLDQAAVSYQVTLTKVDKIKANVVEDILQKTHAELARHVAAHPIIRCTSAAKNLGVEDLRAELARLISPSGQMSG